AAGTRATTTLQLKWTAPGDDGATGTATAYDVRYNTCPLDATSYITATRFDAAAPHAAGTAETLTITGLTVKTSYCFALKAIDDAANFSPLSNVLQARTLDNVPPATPVLTAGTIAATSVQVKWTAVGDDGNSGTVSS